MAADFIQPGHVFAAIDCGSNSTRLLISDGVQALKRKTRITGMGRGVQQTGLLPEDGLDRVAAALTAFAETIRSLNAATVSVIATSAARDASNSSKLFELVSSAIGVAPTIISGDQEASLSFAGATSSLDRGSAPFLVVDIGGGSTELATGSTKLGHSVSLNIGSVRFSDLFLESDPPSPKQLESCLAAVDSNLDQVLETVPDIHDASLLVGLAGTVTTTASICAGLERYDFEKIHHKTLTAAEVQNTLSMLSLQSRAERTQTVGLEPGRVDTIVAGLCILSRVMDRFGYASLVVSETDILDGLVMSMAKEQAL